MLHCSVFRHSAPHGCTLILYVDHLSLEGSLVLCGEKTPGWYLSKSAAL